MSLIMVSCKSVTSQNDQKMQFESHIFQVKRDLTDTSLVTLCLAIGKKIVPMLNMRKQ